MLQQVDEEIIMLDDRRDDVGRRSQTIGLLFWRILDLLPPFVVGLVLDPVEGILKSCRSSPVTTSSRIR